MNEGNVRRPEPVPYVIHQAVLARMDRTNRRMQLLCFSLIVLFAGTSGWRALRNRRLK